MRKNLFIVAFVTMFILACKTSQTVVVPTGADSPTGVVAAVAEGSACYELQEQKPALRAVGNGINNKEANAKQRANTQAQAEFAQKISASIIAACEEVGVSLEQYSGDGESGQAVADESEEGGNLASMVAKQSVKNTSIIKTERYIMKDKRYLVYVCIEYSGNLSELIADAEKQLKEQISPEQRKTLEERHDKFVKKMEQRMNDL